jgi:hypothetical protein
MRRGPFRTSVLARSATSQHSPEQPACLPGFSHLRVMGLTTCVVDPRKAEAAMIARVFLPTLILIMLWLTGCARSHDPLVLSTGVDVVDDIPVGPSGESASFRDTSMADQDWGRLPEQDVTATDVVQANVDTMEVSVSYSDGVTGEDGLQITEHDVELVTYYCYYPGDEWHDENSLGITEPGPSVKAARSGILVAWDGAFHEECHMPSKFIMTKQGNTILLELVDDCMDYDMINPQCICFDVACYSLATTEIKLKPGIYVIRVRCIITGIYGSCGNYESTFTVAVG